MSKKPYTQDQKDHIAELYGKIGPDWIQIANAFNKKYGDTRTAVGVQRAYERYGSNLQIDNTEAAISHIKQIRRTKKTNSTIKKQNDFLIDQFNYIDSVKKAADIISKTKYQKVRLDKADKIDPKKKNMCKEIVLSDLHYGKVTEHFNNEVAKKRMSYLADVFIREVRDDQKTFNVNKIIVAILGDVIESYTMHGLESARNCEFETPSQVAEATLSIFNDLLLPVAKLGIPVIVPCVPGNHDRTEVKQTLSRVGKNSMSYPIYVLLEALCKAHGLTNVTFEITEQTYVILDVFGDKILYHHGDLAFKGKGHNKLKTFRRDVEDQVGFKIHGSRSGHTHEYVVYGRGEDIVNGCLVGQDEYAHSKGYSTEASQTINDYIDTKKERTKFYKSFAVCLETIK